MSLQKLNTKGKKNHEKETLDGTFRQLPWPPSEAVKADFKATKFN